MSSIIEHSASSTEAPSNGQAGSRIVHFDATVRRKERMRQRASVDVQPSPTASATPAATPPAPATPPMQSAPAEPKRNGAFAHPAASVPPAPAAKAPTAPEKSNGLHGNNGVHNSNGTHAGNGTAKTSSAPAMPSGAELEKFLVDFVVEQTGYPEEMVELDADLEADLGIDSIKKAQLFGELAERFEIDVQGADASELSLDDFPTLRHVKSFLENSENASAATPAAPAAPQPEVSATAPAPVAATPEPIAATPAATASTLPEGAELEKFLIDFVVEQTGYPEEMVELDADLEADLGIDSIKKAQLFGELAEQFQIDVQGADTTELSLDDFPTLRHVMAFLQDAPAASATPAAPSPQPATTPAPAASTATVAPTPAPKTPEPAPTAASAPAASLPQGPELEKFLIDFVVEQTGYPEEMVELDADLEADLGIDSIKKAQLFGELAEQFQIDVQGADASELSLDDFPTLRHVMAFLQDAPAATAAPETNTAPVASTPAAIAAPAVAPTPVPPPTPTPAPSTPAAPQSAAPAGATMSGAELEQFLVNFVVEQTGYPPEMVEMDADLEADLGIDSIKKAQLFGELAEQFEVNLDSVEELSLDDFPTLRDVMKFLEGVPQKATA